MARIYTQDIQNGRQCGSVKLGRDYKNCYVIKTSFFFNLIQQENLPDILGWKNSTIRKKNIKKRSIVFRIKKKQRTYE